MTFRIATILLLTFSIPAILAGGGGYWPHMYDTFRIDIDVSDIGSQKLLDGKFYVKLLDKDDKYLIDWDYGWKREHGVSIPRYSSTYLESGKSYLAIYDLDFFRAKTINSIQVTLVPYRDEDKDKTVKISKVT